GSLTLTSSDEATITATADTTVNGKDGVGKVAGNVGFILAFNTIGWQAENVLALSVDALLGGDVVSGNTPSDATEVNSTFGGEHEDISEAYIQGSTIHAAGDDVSLSATTGATITAVDGNETETTAVNDVAI